jgi:hypothetical protein
MNTARFTTGAGDSNTSAIAMGGSGPPGDTGTGATELWDGTSWTSNPTGLATARNGIGGAGTQTSALAFGGGNPGVTANTEEWTGLGLATRTITVS